MAVSRPENVHPVSRSWICSVGAGRQLGEGSPSTGLKPAGCRSCFSRSEEHTSACPSLSRPENVHPVSRSWICSVGAGRQLGEGSPSTGLKPAGCRSCFSLWRVLETPPPPIDLLKFCQKGLDILTNREHYVSTLGREIPLFGPIYV